jgi:hypothetical protein
LRKQGILHNIILDLFKFKDNDTEVFFVVNSIRKILF